MYTTNQMFSEFLFHIALLVLGTTLLSSCDQSQQLGIEDNPQELLERKLNDPDTVLTPDQSISIISHGTQPGEQNATNAADKVVTVFMGNTGAGKSATINSLMRREMTIENKNNTRTETERERLQRELAQLKNSTKEPPTAESTK